jgi:4'-phosphopantetheinyl transferase
MEEPPALSERRVDVWRVSLDDDADRIDARGRVLSADEADRARRFRSPVDRDIYVLTHGLLRILVGEYAHTDPAALVFGEGARGKPTLPAGRNSTGLWFNVSHSDRLACVAITAAGEIGVDVERAAPDMAATRLPERFFAPGEVAAIRRLPDADQDAAFVRCWTRKEAYVKALGTGLGEHLDRFEVSIAPGAPAGLVWTADRPDEPARWTFHDLPVDAGYAGAVAVRSSGIDLACWQWADG